MENDLKQTTKEGVNGDNGDGEKANNYESSTSWQEADFLSFDSVKALATSTAATSNNSDTNKKRKAVDHSSISSSNGPISQTPTQSYDYDHRTGYDGYSNMEENEQLPPWMKQAHDFDRTLPLVALHNEIVGFVNLMSPLQEEIREREVLVERFRALVNPLFDCDVEVFGSQATGLCLPTSDIDIVILMKNKDEQQAEETSEAQDGGAKKNRNKKKKTNKSGKSNNGNDAENKSVDAGPDGTGIEQNEEESWQKLTEKKPLEKLAQALRDHWIEELSYMEVIENTRVPLVKFTHGPTGISVDVSFDVGTGPQAATLIKTYLKAMPPLRPLTILLKYFLASRALNEPYTGGVGSFMIQMMIVSFLQHRERDIYNFRRPSLYNLGGLLLDFLELYGTDFNYVTTGISVRHDGFYFPKGAGDVKSVFSEATRPFMMAMENPLETNMDVGKPSFRIQTLQRSFAVAHKVLLAYVAEPINYCTSILATILPPTEEMTKRSLLKASPLTKLDRPLSAKREMTPKKKRARGRY